MKIVLVQSKFLVKFCLIFFVTNISNIDRHSSIHQNKASWWIVCVKYLQISQILIITSGENYWILNWFWSSPKQSPHKKGSTDKRGKLNCFMFKVRWCLLVTSHFWHMGEPQWLIGLSAWIELWRNALKISFLGWFLDLLLFSLL